MNGAPSRVTPDTVALALALGLVVVLLLVSAIALVEITETPPAPLAAENLTQILATVLGGMVGVLGAYLGRSARRRPRPGPELVELAPVEIPARPVSRYPRRPYDQDAPTEELERDEAPPRLTSLGAPRRARESRARAR